MNKYFTYLHRIEDSETQIHIWMDGDYVRLYNIYEIHFYGNFITSSKHKILL